MTEKKATQAAQAQEEGQPLGAEGDPTALERIAALQAEEGRLDVTIPGGYYMASDGTTATNCWGHPIDEYGVVTDETVFIQ